jgi:hypothetical protein
MQLDNWYFLQENFRWLLTKRTIFWKRNMYVTSLTFLLTFDVLI